MTPVGKKPVWTASAEEELARVPGFVRGMARRAVEKLAAEAGLDEIGPEQVRAARERHVRFAESHREEPRRAPRIAVVRCETVSEVCPGVGCLQAVQAKHAHFAGYAEGVELVGFFTCGGCPGRRVGRLVERLLDFGLDAVHLSSCVMLEGEYPRCPHREQMARTIEARGVRVVKGTHH